ncbi:MAG: 4Fe-4S binding protein [candidate division WOR-3 bacterium]|nr:4Fe-4S binding protein [candidate division WOR-3 bacterium]
MSNAAKAEVFVISERCKGCGICIEVCQAQVLEKSTAANNDGYYLPQIKDPDACLGCGMCEMLCPDFAIWVRVVETEETSS